jgi:hypothetical protein
MIGHKDEEPDWVMWLLITVALNVAANMYVLWWVLS